MAGFCGEANETRLSSSPRQWENRTSMLRLGAQFELADARFQGAVQLACTAQPGGKVDALLSQDEDVWDCVTWSIRSGEHLRVEIQRRGSEGFSESARFPDD
jgi:hypothetical protein